MYVISKNTAHFYAVHWRSEDNDRFSHKADLCLTETKHYHNTLYKWDKKKNYR